MNYIADIASAGSRTGTHRVRVALAGSKVVIFKAGAGATVDDFAPTEKFKAFQRTIIRRLWWCPIQCGRSCCYVPRFRGFRCTRRFAASNRVARFQFAVSVDATIALRSLDVLFAITLARTRVARAGIFFGAVVVAAACGALAVICSREMVGAAVTLVAIVPFVARAHTIGIASHAIATGFVTFAFCTFGTIFDQEEPIFAALARCAGEPIFAGALAVGVAVDVAIDSTIGVAVAFSTPIVVVIVHGVSSFEVYVHVRQNVCKSA